MKYMTKSGFTLIELLVTILIASIMLFISIPTLTSISNEVRFKSIQQRLILDLTYTRSEAIDQGNLVTICPSNSNTSCMTALTDWSQGWIIFSDIDGNSLFDPGTDELLRASEVDALVRIIWSGTSTVSFMGSGLATELSSGNFRICDARGGSSIVKGISIALSGRIRTNNSVPCP